MKYLSQPFSSKLNKMGIKHGESKREMYWIRISEGNEWGLMIISPGEEVRGFTKVGWKVTPAYDLASIMDKEALRVMFGTESTITINCPDCEKAGDAIPECFECGGTQKSEIKVKVDTKKVEIEAHQLLDKYLAGGMEAVEKYLEEVL